MRPIFPEAGNFIYKHFINNFCLPHCCSHWQGTPDPDWPLGHPVLPDFWDSSIERWQLATSHECNPQCSPAPCSDFWRCWRVDPPLLCPADQEQRSFLDPVQGHQGSALWGQRRLGGHWRQGNSGHLVQASSRELWPGSERRLQVRSSDDDRLPASAARARKSEINKRNYVSPTCRPISSSFTRYKIATQGYLDVF